jgi:tetratricopeptide (TPR) repeat protein
LRNGSNAYESITARAAHLAGWLAAGLAILPQFWGADFRWEAICYASGSQEVSGSSTETNSDDKVPAAANRSFAEAQNLLRQGQVADALAAVRAGLALAPASLEGLNLLGMAYDQLADYRQSLAAYQKALSINPHLPQTHNNLGKSYVLQKQYVQAEREFRATLALQPRDVTANYNLGLVLLAKGEPRQAILFLSRVHPADTAVLLRLIQAEFEADERAKAIETARAVSTRAPSDVQLHFSLGLLLDSQQEYVEAQHELQIADALQPGNFEILHNLGQAYVHGGQGMKAEPILQRALQLRPDSPTTIYLLARVYEDRRQDALALELLSRAHKLDPKNTNVLFQMGRLSMLEHYYEDAIQVLGEGVSIEPKRADFHAALGESYFAVGKVDKSIEEFNALIRLDPSAQSYAFMGLCYRHLGRFEEAQRYFSLGLKIDPRNAVCLYNLGLIESKQIHYSAAEKWLTASLEAKPDYTDALYELAGIRMRENRYSEAVDLLRRCAALNSTRADVYYRLASAERELHQIEGAERDLKIFQTLSKESDAGPYPFQHFFDYWNDTAGLPREQKTQLALDDLLRAAEQRPNDPRLLYLLAENYLKLGRRSDALATLAQLDAATGADARTQLGVGVLLLRYGIYPQAIQHFQAASVANTTSDDAKYDLANAYFQEREYQLALEALKQVSPQFIRDESYLALRGDIEAHLGHYSEAAEALEEAVKKSPDNDQYYLSLALAQLRSGAISAAVRSVQRGLARIPDSGKLVWGMGVVAAVKGDGAQAEQYLRKALDLMPEWSSSYSALALLYGEAQETDKARQVLEQYIQVSPSSAAEVARIQQALGTAETPNPAAVKMRSLSPPERLQFLEVALALADHPR